MCNAWNHPVQCTCGWGGVGHQGKRTVGDNAPNPWLKYWGFTRESSYTNPNASCPVCGASVYFYQSPNGGRVFFDELGPPWPKHPCTNNPKIPVPAPKFITDTKTTISREYTWQKDGWIPFIVDNIVPLPPQFKIFNIRGTSNGKDFSLYTSIKGLNANAPYLVKKLNESEYYLSTVQFNQSSALAKELNLFGYLFASAVPKKTSKHRPNWTGK